MQKQRDMVQWYFMCSEVQWVFFFSCTQFSDLHKSLKDAGNVEKVACETYRILGLIQKGKDNKSRKVHKSFIRFFLKHNYDHEAMGTANQDFQEGQGWTIERRIYRTMRK